MSEKNLLQNVYLFRQLTAEELQKLNNIAKVESYIPGDDVFTQGDVADAMCVIRFGSVRITQNSSEDDKIEVAVLGTGSHFGEMAFVDDEPRSASVSVVEKTEIVKLGYSDLKALLEQDKNIAVKFYAALAHFLCGRLRLTTRDLSFAREKNLQYF